MENTFWDVDREGNYFFVGLFKESFKSYVESGMRKTMERDIEILRDDEGEFSVTKVTKDFKAKFYKFIVDHYFCKFHCFYLHSTHLIMVFTY